MVCVNVRIISLLNESNHLFIGAGEYCTHSD